MKTFQEKSGEDHSQLFTVDAVLYRSRTELQDVLVFENRLFGRVLVLDGVVQLTERDNHIYHEVIAHVPLIAHGSAKRVLIVGGGDGGTLKEVLKHPVEQAVLVEIDGGVIALARRFFPTVSEGAFDDPRASIIVGDGVRYVAEADSTFDAIIVDSTDPIGPGEQLFTADFYRDCRRLLRPGGVIALQSGAPFYQPERIRPLCDRLSLSFHAVGTFLAPVPTYPGGMLALVFARAGEGPLVPTMQILQSRFQHLSGSTSYYTPEIHRAAFVLPPTFMPHSLQGRAGVGTQEAQPPYAAKAG